MNALIIDDELPAQKILRSLLEEHCKKIKIIACVSSAKEAREVLRNEVIDVLFLDVNMPRESGFDLLQSIASHDYSVVFVTGNQEYALRALKASAVDFLLKPVDIEELKEAIKKLEYFQQLRRNNTNLDEQYRLSLNELSSNLQHDRKITRLTLNHLQGFKIIAIDDIVYLEAERNYTVFHMRNLEKIMVSRGIGDYESLLDPEKFFRTHKSFIINLGYLKEYSTADGYFAIMPDGISVLISRRRIDEFQNAVKRFSSLK